MSVIRYANEIEDLIAEALHVAEFDYGDDEEETAEDRTEKLDKVVALLHKMRRLI